MLYVIEWRPTVSYKLSPAEHKCHFIQLAAENDSVRTIVVVDASK